MERLALVIPSCRINPSQVIVYDVIKTKIHFKTINVLFLHALYKKKIRNSDYCKSEVNLVGAFIKKAFRDIVLKAFLSDEECYIALIKGVFTILAFRRLLRTFRYTSVPKAA